MDKASTSAEEAHSCTTEVLIESQQVMAGKVLKVNLDFAERQQDDVSIINDSQEPQVSCIEIYDPLDHEAHLCIRFFPIKMVKDQDESFYYIQYPKSP